MQNASAFCMSTRPLPGFSLRGGGMCSTSQRRMTCATDLHGLVENVMLALGKRRPGFDKHAFCLQGFHLCLPLVERIDFNLVHLRHGLVENSQINGAVRGEIADANGTNAATPIRRSAGCARSWRQRSRKRANR